jgi:hypothetical protein
MNPILFATALKTLTLGKDIAANRVMAPREAKLCQPVPVLVITGADKPTVTPTSIDYQITVENPSEKPIEICFMHFSVVTAPIVMLALTADGGLVEPPRLPEVYPIADEKVAFEKLLLPARTRLAIDARIPIQRASYAKAKNLKLVWSVILNHEYHSGTIPVTP